MVDVMRYWLGKGCDGFRVDMADSLVKNDDDHKSGTVKVWQDMLGRIHREFPAAVFVSEWGRPQESIPAGFDMDFYLDWMGNGYNSLLRNYAVYLKAPGEKLRPDSEDHSYFRKDHGGSIEHFLEEYMPRYEQSKDDGYIALITGNHDTTRISNNLSAEELKLAYAFLFTMPGTPFLYYGDEIGMHFLDVPTKEGGYTRTGSRTPMQWNNSANKGFSTADASMLYLPVDTASDAPTVAEQETDDDSLLNTVRRIIKLRHAESALKTNNNLEILSKEPFVYKRGNLYLALNPDSADKNYELPSDATYEMIFAIANASLTEHTITLKGSGFCIIKADSSLS
jgi:maltose alpha-D-glucosyltransferase/alpha-amylase